MLLISDEMKDNIRYPVIRYNVTVDTPVLRYINQKTNPMTAPASTGSKKYISITSTTGFPYIPLIFTDSSIAIDIMSVNLMNVIRIHECIIANTNI